MSAAFEEALRESAESYADWTTPEALVEAALARRDWRARRAGARACVVCGGPMIARRADAVTCSQKCRQKRASNRRVNVA